MRVQDGKIVDLTGKHIVDLLLTKVCACGFVAEAGRSHYFF